jgi:two-component system cell cycle sensor histidine kinase/response regulator CckA
MNEVKCGRSDVHGANHNGANHASTSFACAPRGNEVVLLVEDDELVRALAKRILTLSGYVVLEAPGGRKGLALCQNEQTVIDLLVTDVVMPDLGGCELADCALTLRPGLKIMFMSGYSQDSVSMNGHRRTSFLQKPFTPVQFATKVRDTIDSNARAAGQS